MNRVAFDISTQAYLNFGIGRGGTGKLIAGNDHKIVTFLERYILKHLDRGIDQLSVKLPDHSIKAGNAAASS